MQYVSTRGLAPSLGFEDALLAGLARDGGLYVPEKWPTLTTGTIAGFAGRPFHEVASSVVDALAGGAIPKWDLERMTAQAYGSFGHAAVTPLVQIGPNRFRAGAVPRADLGVQGRRHATPRAADGLRS